MLGTTRQFLDYFNLKNLDEMPPLADIQDIDKLYPELDFKAHPEAGTEPIVDDDKDDGDELVESFMEEAKEEPDTKQEQSNSDS
jgi:segregation and condensation protein B